MSRSTYIQGINYIEATGVLKSGDDWKYETNYG